MSEDRMADQKDRVRKSLIRLETGRKRILRPGFLELGLTLGMGQPRILNQLYLQDGVTQKQLAERCEMDVTTLSRTLDRMEEAGWVERKKQPQCRRSFSVCLTQEGRKKAAGVREGFYRLDCRLCDGFSQEELDCLLGFLERLEKNLDTEEE